MENKVNEAKIKTQVNLKLDEKTMNKIDKKAKEEGRSRTNLIENILKNNLGKNYWLWVNSGQMDIGGDEIKENGGEWAGCHKDSEKGDEVLIYRTNPHKHIKYLAEITEDAKKSKIPTNKGMKDGYTCSFVIKRSFENPFEISEMRKYESLKEWLPLKISFVKMVFEIQEKYWNTINDILITKNPD